MNTKFLVPTAFAALLGVASTPVAADCYATVDLRPTASQGGSDIIRLTNQSTQNGRTVLFQVVYPSGTAIGNGVENFNSFESKALTVSDIFSEAFGPLGYSIGSWPTRFIKIWEIGNQTPTPNFQGTVTNYQTKVVTPLVFTCNAF